MTDSTTDRNFPLVPRSTVISTVREYLTSVWLDTPTPPAPTPSPQHVQRLDPSKKVLVLAYNFRAYRAWVTEIMKQGLYSGMRCGDFFYPSFIHSLRGVRPDCLQLVKLPGWEHSIYQYTPEQEFLDLLDRTFPDWRTQPEWGAQSAQSVNQCQSCAYFMRGVKFGEPSICNAFHAPNGGESCPDYTPNSSSPSSPRSGGHW